MTITMYGIKACSTVKKARDWLDAHNIVYDFHDYKLAGADPNRLRAWCEEFGWEVVLNRAGTTFRKLSEGDKENLDIKKAITLMQAQPSMIKRPIVETDTRRLVGFKPELYREAFTE
jgi:arsenate reductase